MFEKIRRRIGKLVAGSVTNLVEKYDQNWFVRFMKIALNEDMGRGASIGDPMAQHAWVNIAVSVRAKNIARAPFRIYQGDEEVTSGEVFDLFKNVNPFMSRYQLWEATDSWLDTRGECIWIFENGYQVGVPKEIYPVDPRNFEHKLDKTGREIVLWIYKQGEDEIPFLPDELIHFYAWNMWDPFRGVNPCKALASELDQDWLADKSNTALLRNGSVPQGVLSAGDEVTISKEVATEVRDRWEKEHRGADRSHRVSVLGNGMKYQSIHLSNSDMEYFKMKGWNRQTILAKYGVNPRVVSASEDSSPLSGKDTLEQMKAFWSLTLIPQSMLIEDKVETAFFDKYAKELRGAFDHSAIPELQEEEDARFTRYITAAAGGVMLINEAREKLGFEEPVPWGDTWWKPMMLSPVDEPPPTRDVTPNPPALPPPKKIYEIALKLPKEREIVIKISPYPEAYKIAHWWKIAKGEDEIEKEFKDELHDWFWEQRKRALLLIAPDKAKAETDLEFIQGELFEESYWLAQEQQLKDISTKYFIMGIEMTGRELETLFKDLGVSVAESFNIYETGAYNKLLDRVNKGALSEITETVRKDLRDKIGQALTEGLSERQTAELVRGVYNKAGNRAATIARTELGGIINDSRFEGFVAVGFKYHSWLSARDGTVRHPPKSDFDHTNDGEIVKLGDRFSNGLRYPNDIDGDAGNVINCRCITLPEEKDG